VSKLTEETRQYDVLKRAFDVHHERLFRLAVLLSKNREDAEDIVQEVFVGSVRRLESLSDTEVGPYLTTAVVNAWNSKLRRLRTVARKTHLLQPPESLDLQAESVSLWAGVKRLPPRQRAAIVLRYYEDLSESETARILGCSVGTVKSQSSRAIRALRKGYEDED
jgi:RNA polymerase sigma-70 factor (sigma-E family)